MTRTRPSLIVLGLAASLFALEARPAVSGGDDKVGVPGWKIWIQKRGLVRIPIADLPGRAFCPAPGSEPQLRLSTGGKPIYFWVNAARTELVFYGEPDPVARDARGRCYHLSRRAETDPSMRIGIRPPVAAPPEGAKTLDYALDTAELQPARPLYDPLEALDLKSLSPLAKKGGYWFAASHEARTPLAISLALKNVDTRGAATLRLEGVFRTRSHREPLPGGRSFERLGLFSGSAPETLAVSVNGTDLDPLPLRGSYPEGDDFEVEVPKDALAKKSELLLSPAKKEGYLLVRRASVDYRCLVAAIDSDVTSTVFTAAGPTRFPKFNGIACDLTTGDLLSVGAASATEGCVASEKGHRILLFAPGKTYAGGSAFEPCKGNDLVQPGTGADWLAIAPRALAKSIEPLAAFRAAQGMKTKVAALEDIEDAFADGAFGPEAIKAFLTWADKNWTPRPRFVLLVGDAARDARPDNGPWLPTALVDTYDNGATATDGLLAPQGVAVGRFPCRTPEQVAALVTKTMEYEETPAGPWQKQLAFVCGEGHFGPMIDSMIENLFTQAVSKRVPDGFDVDVTYANPTSVYLYPPDQFSDRVVERLSQGSLIFDYIGHGATESLDDVHWGAKRFPILRRQDAERVHCEKGQYPIALITACWTGCFDQPETTVGEALVLNPRGPVAVFAASRVSHPFANALLSLDLTRRLFQRGPEVTADRRPRLGERLRAALDELSLESGGAEGKTVVAFGSSMLGEKGLAPRLIEDERHLYNLLGDPALAIRYPRQLSVDAGAQAQAGTSFPVELEASDPLTLVTATLERMRGVPKGLEGLPAETGPDALADPAVRKRVLETYARANAPIVVTGTVKGARAVLDLPATLEPGTYVLKVYARMVKGGEGLVASSRIEVAAAAPEQPKKRRWF
jgi:hypothetical protein